MSKTQFKVEKTPQGVYLLFRKQHGQRKWWPQSAPPTQEQIIEFERKLAITNLFGQQTLDEMLSFMKLR